MIYEVKIQFPKRRGITEVRYITSVEGSETSAKAQALLKHYEGSAIIQSIMPMDENIIVTMLNNFEG